MDEKIELINAMRSWGSSSLAVLFLQNPIAKQSEHSSSVK
jgi:hypothetical protein